MFCTVNIAHNSDTRNLILVRQTQAVLAKYCGLSYRSDCVRNAQRLLPTSRNLVQPSWQVAIDVCDHEMDCSCLFITRGTIMTDLAPNITEIVSERRQTKWLFEDALILIREYLDYSLENTPLRTN